MKRRIAVVGAVACSIGAEAAAVSVHPAAIVAASVCPLLTERAQSTHLTPSTCEETHHAS